MVGGDTSPITASIATGPRRERRLKSLLSLGVEGEGREAQRVDGMHAALLLGEGRDGRRKEVAEVIENFLYWCIFLHCFLSV
jgi:hypothetical protein